MHKNEEYKLRYKQEYNEDILVFTEYGYDAIKVFSEVDPKKK